MRVLLAAGGTAGHINPAISIAKRFSKDNADVLFVGTKKGMEEELVSREGFNIKFVEIEGFKRSLSPYNLKVIYLAAKAISASKKIIKEFKPDVVIGCGGYVSGPVVLAATMMGIPTLIHEQNVFPGFTTKLLSHRVDRVAISFRESEKYFKKSNKIVFTGNPIRSSIKDINKEIVRFKYNIDKPFILVFGGSLGAQKLNKSMLELMKTLQLDVSILWGTGKKNYDGIISKISEEKIVNNRFKIEPYIYNMDEIMVATDLVIARSGAITISEICAMGKPSVLIPSPYVTHNHQEYNARAVEKIGGAVVIKEQDLTSEKLQQVIKELIMDNERLIHMGHAVKGIAELIADEKIYEIAKSLIFIK